MLRSSCVILLMTAVAMPEAAAQLQMQEHAVGKPAGRVFCYNRYSGRFLHWGNSCVRPAPAPRVRRRPGEKVSHPPKKPMPASRPK